MRTYLLFLFLLVGIYCFGQGHVVNGKVMNEEDNPIAFASVMIKGTREATAANEKGKFSLRIRKFPAVLVCNAVGYATAELTIKDSTYSKEIRFKLTPHRVSLEEVVVTGFSTERRASHYSIASAPAIDRSDLFAKSEHLARKKTPGRSGDGSRVRLLTAGELSDFKKWKLWNDYTDSEFSSYSDQWQLELKKRFCVQVQNNRHQPLVGEKVYLLNRDTRDTVWMAFTDNTGKAELWSDYYQDANEQVAYVMACGNVLINFPMNFEQGINRMTINRDCQARSLVDIAFVVDATGSMGDEISYLQSEMADIINNTSKKYSDVKLRLGSVFYRDHGDEYLTRQLDFQEDPSLLVNFINEQKAGGGGDFPEAVEDALTVALEHLSWSTDARTKILFLVLDAPPHDAAKAKMKTLIGKAAAMGIRIVPIACSGINKSTEYLMRCAALATNGSYVFLTDDSGIGNPHIKPTTDEFKVELLNELLQRLIGEMIYVPSCNGKSQPPVAINDSTEVLVKVNIFPNPTSGQVSIESEGALQEVYLTDFAGKMLMRMDSRDKKRRWTLRLHAYPSGTYLVKYYIKDKGWGAEKIVLIH